MAALSALRARLAALGARVDRLLAPLDALGAKLSPAAPVARLLWFLGIALFVTWPVVLDLDGLVLGLDEASAPCHVWVLWWAQHHIEDIHTELIFYPSGADVVTLYGSDVLSPLLLRWFPVPAQVLYNLWVIFLLVLGASGVDRLARRLGAAAGGALLGGTVWAVAPFFQHEIVNGTSEIVAAATLPWFAIAMLRLLDLPVGARRGRIVGAGLAVGIVYGLSVAASAYNLFFGLLVAGAITAVRVVTSDVPLLRREIVGGVAAAVAAVAPIGAGLAVLQLTHGATEVYSRRESWTSEELAMPDSFAQLDMWFSRADAIIPAIRVMPDGEEFEYWTTCSVFLGWFVVLLALWGWRRAKQGAVSRPALSVATWLVLLSALIATGPYVRMKGEIVRVAESHIPMPALLVAELFPPFVVTAVHAYRYTAVLMVGLGLLVAFAVKRWWTAPLLAVVVLFDVVLLGPLPWPAATTVMPSPDGVLAELRDADDGAVLHYPLEKENLGDIGRALLAQTVHEKPIQDGGIHRRAGEESLALFEEILLLSDFADRRQALLRGQAESSFSIRQLYLAGYRYILVDLTEDGGPEFERWLLDVVGPAESKDERFGLWLVPEKTRFMRQREAREAAKAEAAAAAAAAALQEAAYAEPERVEAPAAPQGEDLAIPTRERGSDATH